MAVTAASLAAALGIAVADASADDDPGIVEAGRLLSIAGDLVTAYLHDDPPDDTDCPADVRDEATIRTSGHVMSRTGYGVGDGRHKVAGVSFEVHTARAAVRQSGAAALLAPWVRRTA